MTASTGDASVAADDDGATAWRTPAQQAGQWLQVDLGSRQRVRSVTLDAGPLTYGWESNGAASTEAPGSYLLQVSADGRRWTDVRRGHGTGQLTVLKTPHTRSATCVRRSRRTHRAAGRSRRCASTAERPCRGRRAAVGWR